MHKSEVQSITQALAYLTECTLATVASMAMLARPSKSELFRQISMAQFGIDHLKGQSLASFSRVNKILTQGVSVEIWAQSYKPSHKVQNDA